MRYTTSFCEREYNARAAIPDHPQIFARWSAQAMATRRLRACLLDLPYGDTAAERLDLFPARSDVAPLLVFIHGGYWRSLDKSDFSWIAPPFVSTGTAVAMLNYGLAPKVPLEDIVRQTLAALAWLYRNGERLGFDRDRIVIAGHSAGAHLGAMAATALWPQYAADLPSRLVKGVLAVSGLYDLEPLLHAPFIQNDLKLDLARAHRMSPAHFPAPAGVRLVTAVGALESGEFRRQTAMIAQRWPASVERELSLPGEHHLSIVDALADPDGALFGALQPLLQGH